MPSKWQSQDLIPYGAKATLPIANTWTFSAISYRPTYRNTGTRKEN